MEKLYLHALEMSHLMSIMKKKTTLKISYLRIAHFYFIFEFPVRSSSLVSFVAVTVLL